MKWNKLSALMFMDLQIFMRSKWRSVEFFYFPVTTVLMWALFANYTKNFSFETGLMVLAINIFWSFAYSVQSTINLLMSEDVWSSGLKQLLVSGIGKFEYLVARVLSSILMSSFIMALMLALTYMFGFAVIFQNPGVILVLIIVTLIASVSMSVIVSGLVFIFGSEYNFLSWTFLQVFLLFSSPFYPLDVLPPVLQNIAYGIPFTYVFMAVRELISTGAVGTGLIASSLASTAIYMAMSLPFYAWAYRFAIRTGRLARMSS
jgi:ABC-2 type transport system permease protein